MLILVLGGALFVGTFLLPVLLSTVIMVIAGICALVSEGLKRLFGRS